METTQSPTIPKTQHPLPPPSELFLSRIRTGGSIVADCELCGRVHFGNGGGDYELGELEDLLQSAKDEPDKFIQHCDDDMVHYGMIAGKQAVTDCPCNGLRRYENFILAHKFLIVEFLADYAEQKHGNTKRVVEAARAAKKAISLLQEEDLKSPGEDSFTRKFDLD